MGEPSDPCILTKAATKREGSTFVPGVLMLTASRLDWSPNDPSSASQVSVQRTAILKTQRAPDKPFIKLEASSSGTVILGFSSLDDRNLVVDVLVAQGAQQASSAAGSAGASGQSRGVKAATGPDAAKKRELLKNDRDLRTLYHQLVNSGLISEAEFWQGRQHLLRAPAGASGAQQPASGQPAQRPGLPSAMLANVRPSADGQTETVHFRLTPEVIQQIFAEKPEVHRAFLAHVPTTLPAKDFWTRYFKAEYQKAARRRKLAQAGKLSSSWDDDDGGEEDDLFAPFRRQQAQQEQAQLRGDMGRVDPTVNLAADVGERLGGGYGLRQTDELEGGAPSAQQGAQQQQRQSAPAGLAYDINRHAAFVLGGAIDGMEEAVAAAAGGQNGDEAAVATQLAAALQAAQLRKQKAAAGSSKVGEGFGGAGVQESDPSPELMEAWRQRATSSLEDLRLDDDASRYIPLSIQDPRLYFERAPPGDKPTQQLAHGVPSSGGREDPGAILSRINPDHLPNPPCSPRLAFQALLELSYQEDQGLVREFGPLAATALGRAPQEVLLEQLLALLRDEALKTNELLRHFWAAVPLVSAPRRQKAERLCGALQEQRGTLQAHMSARPGTSEQVYITQMLRPVVASIDAALEKHEEELSLLAKSQQAAALRQMTPAAR